MAAHDAVDEELFRHGAGDPRQAELVARVCRELEVNLRTAASPRAAEELAGSACREFDASCESSLLKDEVRKHAAELLRRFWGT